MGNLIRKTIVVLALGLASIMSASGALFAAGFAPASVEYSADRHMSTSEGAAMTGKVYSAAGKERNEFGAGETVSITRMDKKLIWMLMPKEKKYMEHAFGEGKREKGNYQECDVRQTAAGEETVNGVRTKKSTVEFSCPDKEKSSGTIWMTKENIVMKMETMAKSGSSKKDVFRMELKNLKIGKQDPNLFEIPAGYQKFEMPSMGDIQKMMKEQAGAEPPTETSTPPSEQPPVDQNIDRAKKLKNLLGW